MDVRLLKELLDQPSLQKELRDNNNNTALDLVRQKILLNKFYCKPTDPRGPEVVQMLLDKTTPERGAAGNCCSAFNQCCFVEKPWLPYVSGACAFLGAGLSYFYSFYWVSIRATARLSPNPLIN